MKKATLPIPTYSEDILLESFPSIWVRLEKPAAGVRYIDLVPGQPPADAFVFSGVVAFDADGERIDAGAEQTLCTLPCE